MSTTTILRVVVSTTHMTYDIILLEVSVHSFLHSLVELPVMVSGQAGGREGGRERRKHGVLVMEPRRLGMHEITAHSINPLLYRTTGKSASGNCPARAHLDHGQNLL